MKLIAGLLSSKSGFIIFAIIYSFTYNFLYNNYLIVYFAYISDLNPTGLSGYPLFFYYTLSTIPLFFFRGFKTLAAGMSFMVYLLIYIPCLHSVLVSDFLSIDSCITLTIALFISIILYFITDGVYIGKNFFLLSKQKFSFRFVFFLTLILLSVVLFSYAGKIRFVNFFVEKTSLLYEMRAEASSDRSAILAYLAKWLKGAFIPLCLVYGLASKNKVVIISMFGAYFLMFMTDYQKITFLMPFIIYGTYLLAKTPHKSNFYFPNQIIIICIALGWIAYMICGSSIGFTISSIIILRTLHCEEWLMTMYMDFFENHPYTYYSHINIVNYFAENYPYDFSLGYAVTNNSFNANACFIITDGLASLGSTGIFIISVVFVLFKAFYNTISLRYNKMVIFVMMLPVIVAFLNVSLFTSILTSGFGMLYLILLFTRLPKIENQRYIN